MSHKGDNIGNCSGLRGEGAVLSARSLSYGFTTSKQIHLILEGVDLDVGEGEMLGIVGPNGCGKTTLLRLLAGLLVPTSGVVESALRPGELGFVFQQSDRNLVPWLKVIDNICLAVAGDRKEGSRAKARSTLEELGLTSLAARYPWELSGGQQQLAVLARWLAFPPRVLLVDEGWSMLDVVQRRRAYSLLTRLRSELGVSVGLVSHSLSDVAEQVDRAAILAARPAHVVRVVELEGLDSQERSDRLWSAARDAFDLHSQR